MAVTAHVLEESKPEEAIEAYRQALLCNRKM